MWVAGGCSGGFQYAAPLLQGDSRLALAPFKKELEKRDGSLHISLAEPSGATLCPSRQRKTGNYVEQRSWWNESFLWPSFITIRTVLQGKNNNHGCLRRSDCVSHQSLLLENVSDMSYEYLKRKPPPPSHLFYRWLINYIPYGSSLWFLLTCKSKEESEKWQANILIRYVFHVYSYFITQQSVKLSI